MAPITDIKNPWRQLLQTPASFRQVIFHVETGARASGRRVVLHEYPKRNDPYAEDMGRAARRFHFTGYLIYRPPPKDPYYRGAGYWYDYTTQRIALVHALELDEGGPLVHPVFCREGPINVLVERYSMTESRERGGYTEFDMQFVEVGKPGNVFDTAASDLVKRSADESDDAAKNNVKEALPSNSDNQFTHSGIVY